ncbi:MAG TPA: ABC transporter ATP-binding protein [Ktedonobacterales bacterium]|nr:ABC transporter ATP-binding protein [Ktedonobacterales bacterium]
MVEQRPTETHPPALAFDSVNFGYGRRAVVRDVTLQVAAGEMVGLLGPNGAGKSTLLRLGAGALRPQAGVVRLDGTDVQRLSRREVARRLAVAPQEFVVQFAYTVRQIVELGRMPHHDIFGLTRREDAHAIEAALVAAGVAHLADRVFNDLSGGERQRVLIALTLAQEAPILLLDEPTAHLDIRYQIETLDLLRRLNAERKLTVLAALHDLNLAARYFPRLLLFRETIVADGPPAHVLDASLLSEVYETPVRVGILRGEQHLSVLPPGQHETVIWQASSVETTVVPAVHVIAGGGSGELMMRALADAGIAFSAGPLNVGDSDYALAQRLAAVCLAEVPYAPVSPERLEAARTRMLAARAVILCPTPLGPGNIGLVEAALAARQAGRIVALLEPTADGPEDADGVLASVGARDFSGHGPELYRQLLDAGCAIAAAPSAALRLLG